MYHPRPPDYPQRPAASQLHNVSSTESLPSQSAESLPRLQAEYVHASAEQVLAADDVLAVIGFADAPAHLDDPRYLRVDLQSDGDTPLEVWRIGAGVRSGRHGALNWSCAQDYLFFSIEVDEESAGGVAAAAEQAYAQIGSWLETHPLPHARPAHVLRLWNYLDAINEGEGDDERYRQFCRGRALGIVGVARAGYSAATAIGRRDGRRVLQVYGLAAGVAGTAIENPRQISAWTYPRQYGPVAPTFARATRTGANQLLISGTAAVVGHQSQHIGDTLAQLDETLRNLDSLHAAAGAEIAARGMAASLLKVYLRDPNDKVAVANTLARHHPALSTPLFLFGDICRNDLRIEIDGIQG